jgi:hypothetical protein
MTPQQAVDEMMGIIKTVAQAQSVTVLWPDVPGDPPTSSSAVWARANVFHADGGQGSLTGGLGTTMYDANGVLWLQLFAPVGDGKVKGYNVGKEFLNALRQHSGSVWLRRHRIEEGGQDGAFNKFDIKADFEYSDVT